MIRTLVRRLFQPATSPPASPASGPAAAPSAPSEGVLPFLVDAHTRTFWSPGAQASETLVEATGGDDRESVGRRVAALVREREAGTPADAPRHRRGITDPAFNEALFVELMREGRYARAWSLLAPDCQERWGSHDTFARHHVDAAAQGAVVGVDVHAVRYLPEWTDPDTQSTYREVAELDVEYAVRAGGRTTRLQRTVHLVPVAGRWRSLCYPPG